MEIEEIKIPVPWGHIAAKSWGKKENQIVLVFHGTTDNAGAFDRLIPLLSTNFYYVCVDFPSHGLSSPYPAHVTINIINHVHSVKLVVEYFKIQKWIFMGHSCGGQALAIFTQLFPEYALKLILIDAIYPYYVPVHNFQDVLRNELKDLQKSRKNSTYYTFEEMLQKLMSNRSFGELSREAAEPILERLKGSLPCADGKYQLFTDPRLKYGCLFTCDIEYIEKLYDEYPITCPILLIVPSNSMMIYEPSGSLVQKFKNNGKLVIAEVEGTHNVHNIAPERIAQFINEFLLILNSKL